MTPPNEQYTLTFESMVGVAALYNDYLLRFAGENGHFSCDLAAAIEPSFDNFFDECHLNEQGARRASAVISTCLTDLGLIA